MKSEGNRTEIAKNQKAAGKGLLRMLMQKAEDVRLDSKNVMPL